METIAAPWKHLEGQEVHGRYPLQKCLAEGDRQAVYETAYREKPAIIKLIRPDSSQTAFRLLASIDAGKAIRHPNLIEIFDSGDIRMGGVRYVYAVMERADDNLGRVLHERPLEVEELRELLPGCLSALEFLHAENLIHTSLKPSNVLAVGDSLKLSSDGLHPASMPRGFAQAPGIYDAPETGSGIYVPASDIYSLAVLLRESATGTPTESGSDRIPAPFDAIVRGGLIRDPQQRWSIARIRAVLNGEPLPAEPLASTNAKPMARLAFRPEKAEAEVVPIGKNLVQDEETEPLYRKYRGVAIAAALLAGIVSAVVVRSAHHKTPVGDPPERVTSAAISGRTLEQGLDTSSPASPLAARQPSPFDTAPVGKEPARKEKAWTVVAATYHREADAEKRAHALRRHHNSLHPQVVSAGESKFLVVFGKGLSQQQAKTVEQKVRRSGAARDAYVTQLEL